ncbi:MAG: type IV secretion system protein [Gammaproteobacteria bacterium]|nr:type IV secretion system protein [Anaerolineae bacterium]MCB1753900.1 type IV secretion system protein [Gammaproteobacteria bacterium]
MAVTKESTEELLKESNNPFLETLGKENTDPYDQQAGAITRLATALLVLSILAICVTGWALYKIEFDSPKPYIVEIDDIGRAQYAGAMNDTPKTLNKYIPAQLAGFVENWRTVTPDVSVLKKNIEAVYCMVNARGGGEKILSDYFRDPVNNPFEVSKKFLHEVKIRTVLAVTEKTYTSEWQETIRDHAGSVVGTPRIYKVNFNVETGPLQEDCEYANPLGIYISNLSWAVIK